MHAKSWTVAVAATAVLGASVLAAAPAQAAWTVSIHGLWNINAPVTAYSVPYEPYSLSFQFPAQTFTTIYQDSDTSVTTQMYNVHYSLNGVAIPVTLYQGDQAECDNLAVGTLCNVAFFDTNLEGGLAMAFSDHVIEFYGADVGSGGTLVPGHYSFVPNIDDTYVDEGTALASITPEPASWTMMLLGAAAIGSAARASRRRAIPPLTA